MIQGTLERLFKTVSIGLKPVFLKAKIQRLGCKGCGLVRQERIRYTEEKKAALVGSPGM